MPSSQRVPTSSDSSTVSLLLKQHAHDRMWFALLSLCDELLSEMTPKKKQKTLFWGFQVGKLFVCSLCQKFTKCKMDV